MSSFQSFLLTCAGTDVEILRREECAIDRIKFSSIGALILITATFAFISGSYALYRVFVGGMSLLGPSDYAYATLMTLVAMGLGLVWALFIFNFDRVVVISLDKHLSWQRLAWIALPRVMVAIFISFVVATPLEVLIFSDRIADQIEKIQAEKRQERFQTLESGFGLGDVRQRLESVDEEYKRVDSLSQAETPSTARYRELRRQLQTCSDTLDAIQSRNRSAIQQQRAVINQRVSERRPIQSAINDKDAQIGQLRDQRQNTDGETQERVRRRIQTLESDINSLAEERDQLNVRIRRASQRIDQLRQEIENQKQTCSSIRGDLQREIQRFRQEKGAEADSLRKVRAEQDSALAATQSLVEEEKKEAESGLERSYSGNFITQLEAMWSLIDEEENSTLLWVNLFLTGLFLFIETGPVLIKLFAPKGAYEKLEAQKNDSITETEAADQEIRKELAPEKSRIRKEVELELYESVLREAKQVKEAVALKRLQQILKDEFDGEMPVIEKRPSQMVISSELNSYHDGDGGPDIHGSNRRKSESEDGKIEIW